MPPRLETLDISHNRIASLHGLSVLTALTRLDAACNDLASVSVLNDLRDSCPQLAVLDLRVNPVAFTKAYRSLAICRLPGLVLLDGVAVTDQDRQAAEAAGSSISEGMLASAMCAAADSDDLLRDCSFRVALDVTAADAPAQCGAPTMLALDSQGLRCFDGLERADAALTAASFADNVLTDLNGLEHLTQLTRLSLRVRPSYALYMTHRNDMLELLIMGT